MIVRQECAAGRGTRARPRRSHGRGAARARVWLAAAALGAAAVPAAGQGTVTGSAYDSLSRAPLRDADVTIRGTDRRATTDAQGQFRLERVPEGRQVVVLSHPGLDSAGFYTLAAVATVAAGRVATVQLATPSLQTVWQRRCEGPLSAAADSGVVLGMVTDAATGNRLAGAGIVALWLDLRQDAAGAAAEYRTVAARTDSIGQYAACGVGTEATVHLRAYGTADSTGMIQVRPGDRPVARVDLTVGRSVLGAAIRGVVRGADARPVVGASIAVDTALTTTDEAGAFVLGNLPAGTQWLIVRTLGRTPLERAVDLRDGDTLAHDVTLEAMAVVLDTVRVSSTRRTFELAEFERRRRSGLGYSLAADQINRRPSMRSVFGTIPQVILGGRLHTFTIMLPTAFGGRCAAVIYIDGTRSSIDMLRVYHPEELAGVEVFPRATQAPERFQEPGSACGVVLVWTKYLQ
jgi:hypothetical protein